MNKENTMKKIAFVTPWYGENIPGGAEMELRGIATHLSDAGYSIEILTTCVKQFTADWNENYYNQGIDKSGKLPVRRFKVRKRDTKAFDAVNLKLMQNMPISNSEQQTYIREMVNSPELYDYISKNVNEYDLFVFIPYMFGTTYYGMKVCLDKAVMIPCFHDESYIYLDVYKEIFQNIKGIIYHAKPEYELANRVFDFTNVKQAVLGEGVHSDYSYDATAFREKYKITEPYILYAGRKDTGKNIYTLLDYYHEYIDRHRDSRLKLVLVGGGDIKIPSELNQNVIDLGFIDQSDKYNACAASLCLCQPSIHESFSLVIMESWLCERPVLVHGECAVTKSFAQESNSGLYFNNYFEFEGCVDYYLEHEDIADEMGRLGRKFVLDNFTWDVIVDKYSNFFEEIIAENRS